MTDSETMTMTTRCRGCNAELKIKVPIWKHKGFDRKNWDEIVKNNDIFKGHTDLRTGIRTASICRHLPKGWGSFYDNTINHIECWAVIKQKERDGKWCEQVMEFE